MNIAIPAEFGSRTFAIYYPGNSRKSTWTVINQTMRSGTIHLSKCRSAMDADGERERQRQSDQRTTRDDSASPSFSISSFGLWLSITHAHNLRVRNKFRPPLYITAASSLTSTVGFGTRRWTNCYLLKCNKQPINSDGSDRNGMTEALSSPPPAIISPYRRHHPLHIIRIHNTYNAYSHVLKYRSSVEPSVSPFVSPIAASNRPETLCRHRGIVLILPPPPLLIVALFV